VLTGGQLADLSESTPAVGPQAADAALRAARSCNVPWDRRLLLTATTGRNSWESLARRMPALILSGSSSITPSLLCCDRGTLALILGRTSMTSPPPINSRPRALLAPKTSSRFNVSPPRAASNAAWIPTCQLALLTP